MRFIGTITQKKPSIAPCVTRLPLGVTMVFSHVRGVSVSSTERSATSCLILVSPLEIVASIARTEHNVNTADLRNVSKLE